MGFRVMIELQDMRSGCQSVRGPQCRTGAGHWVSGWRGLAEGTWAVAPLAQDIPCRIFPDKPSVYKFSATDKSK